MENVHVSFVYLADPHYDHQNEVDRRPEVNSFKVGQHLVGILNEENKEMISPVTNTICTLLIWAPSKYDPCLILLTLILTE